MKALFTFAILGLASAAIICPSHDWPAIVAHGRVTGRLGDMIPPRP